jgi:hypothetical protein
MVAEDEPEARASEWPTASVAIRVCVAVSDKARQAGRDRQRSSRDSRIGFRVAHSHHAEHDRRQLCNQPKHRCQHSNGVGAERQQALRLGGGCPSPCGPRRLSTLVYISLTPRCRPLPRPVSGHSCNPRFSLDLRRNLASFFLHAFRLACGLLHVAYTIAADNCKHGRNFGLAVDANPRAREWALPATRRA